MERLEIQVLNGLHAGARFPFSGAGFSLGGDDADLRLLDEEFEGVFLSFTQLESGALAITADDEQSYVIVDADGRSFGQAERWEAGQFLKVGEFWFALEERGAAAAIRPQLIEEIVEEEAEAGFEMPELVVPAEIMAATQAEARVEASPAVNNYLRLRRKAAAGLVGGVLAILVVGLGFAGMPSEAHTNDRAAKKTDFQPAPVAAVKPKAVPIVAPEPVVPPEQQVKEFVETLLQEHGLKEHVSFRLKDHEIKLSGSVPRREVRGLDRVMFEIENRFGQDYKIAGRVDTIQTGPDFRIREVVMGKDGWIVTDTGRRVLVGGEIGGYRLASITASKVVLVGPERLEIDL